MVWMWFHLIYFRSSTALQWISCLDLNSSLPTNNVIIPVNIDWWNTNLSVNTGWEILLPWPCQFPEPSFSPAARFAAESPIHTLSAVTDTSQISDLSRGPCHPRQRQMWIRRRNECFVYFPEERERSPPSCILLTQKGGRGGYVAERRRVRNFQ